MIFTRAGKPTHWFWSFAISGVALTTIALLAAPDLAAQRPASTAAEERGIQGDHPDFTGSWLRPSGGYGFDEKEACKDVKNAFGGPLIRCSLPFSELKNYLHPRALAWLDFVDERMSTKWVCAPPTVPVLLDCCVFTFSQISETELLIENELPTTGFVARTIYMDGRSHPAPIHLFYAGQTIGWYDQGDLVLETTNFTFDPDGLEDHSHLPSSSFKKVTERYKKVAADKLMATITVEDRLFLKRPYTWSFPLTKTTHPEAAINDCDIKGTWQEMEEDTPNKYEGK